MLSFLVIISSTYRDMGISCISLGISGREDGVNEDKCANDFSTQTSAFAVAICELIGTTAISIVVSLLESFNQTATTYGTQALSHDVHERPWECHLSSQKQPKCHRRVNVSSWSKSIPKLLSN
ncbi:hypothetical protein HanRHA438_Chr07g0312501 [Helianthus annuus]|nr:hypothetical protein HanRHA438_Chr07g0312501 [Helianthus annuus]